MLSLRYMLKSKGCERIPWDNERVPDEYFYMDGFYKENCSEKKIYVLESLDKISKQLGVEEK